MPKHEPNQYLEFVAADLVPKQNEFLIESHRPKKFRTAYHHHASVEINFVWGCDLNYSFSGTAFTVPREQMTVFWGAVPHGVISVDGSGTAVNIYISLAQILQWGLPKTFTEAVVSGAVICARERSDFDQKKFASWARDYARGDLAWRRLVLGEIEMRLRRMALEGYEVIMPGAKAAPVNINGAVAMRHIDQMLRFIADNYANPISVGDVAEFVDLSPSYAMSLFRRAVGVPIKEHITRIRLSHAQMLLANSDNKILSVAMDSGFGSLSSFYQVFQSHAHKTPAAFRRETRQ